MVMAYEINPLILRKLDSMNLNQDFKRLIVELLDFEKNKLNYQESKWKKFYESKFTNYLEKQTAGLKLTEASTQEKKPKVELTEVRKEKHTTPVEKKSKARKAKKERRAKHKRMSSKKRGARKRRGSKR